MTWFARAYRMARPVMITRLAGAVSIQETANLAARDLALKLI